MTYEAPIDPPETDDYDEDALAEAADELLSSIEATLPRWLLADDHFLEVLLDCCLEKVSADFTDAEEARLEAAAEANEEAASAANSGAMVGKERRSHHQCQDREWHTFSLR